MASYLILTPAGGPDRDHRSTRFIRDGFSGAAFLFPVIWLLVHRLWLAGIAAFLLQGIGVALMQKPGLLAAGIAMQFGVCLLAGLEARNLQAKSLLSRDWQLDAIVTADSVDIAETIYFSNDAAPQIVAERVSVDWASASAAATRRQGRNGPALGLLDIEGGR